MRPDGPMPACRRSTAMRRRGARFSTSCAAGDHSGGMSSEGWVCPERPAVAVVGAGPAGLMAAEVLAAGGAAVTVYERMPSPARKLLMAGRGGLNLTHGEPTSAFRARYGAAEVGLMPALDGFDPAALRFWCRDLGIDTFVGTSGRVFPVAFKASPLLRLWLRRLDASGVRLFTRHRWIGFHGWPSKAMALRFETPEGSVIVRADAAVLACGGASWPRLGSDGAWVAPLREAGVGVERLRPANCGFTIPWSAAFRERFAGEPLKNVRLGFGDATSRGDAIVTTAGLEGGAVYPLAAALRDAIEREGEAILHLALRPDLPRDALAAKLARRRPKQSLATALRKTLNLAPVAVALLREACGVDAMPSEPDALAALVNAVPLRLVAPASMERAISSAGGVGFAEVDGRFMLRARPGTFVAGEMLDWEAPTGGYLLQACFATGAAAAHGTLAWLREKGRC